MEYEDSDDVEDVKAGSFYSTPNGTNTTFSFFREDDENYHFTETKPSTGSEMTFTTTISNPHLWNGIEDPFLKDLDSDEKKNYFRLLEIIKLNTFVNEYVYKIFVNDSELIDYINKFINKGLLLEIVSNLEENIDVIIDSNNDSSLKEYASKLDIPYINTNNRNEALTFILNSIKEKLLIKINDVKELKLKK